MFFRFPSTCFCQTPTYASKLMPSGPCFTIPRLRPHHRRIPLWGKDFSILNFQALRFCIEVTNFPPSTHFLTVPRSPSPHDSALGYQFFEPRLSTLSPHASALILPLINPRTPRLVIPLWNNETSNPNPFPPRLSAPLWGYTSSKLYNVLQLDFCGTSPR